MKWGYWKCGENFNDLDSRSNQPQHSLKPKANPKQGPNSLQFYAGWERWGNWGIMAKPIQYCKVISLQLK